MENNVEFDKRSTDLTLQFSNLFDNHQLEDAVSILVENVDQINKSDLLSIKNEVELYKSDALDNVTAERFEKFQNKVDRIVDSQVSKFDKEIASHPEKQKAFDILYEEVYSKISDSKEPSAIYTAGQPGSGKSSVVNSVLSEKQAVVIDTDHFRRFHPQYDQVMRDTPQLAYEIMDTFSFAAAEKIVDQAIADKKNIVFDGTFGGNYSFIEQSVEKMRKAGYKLELAALALNPQTSTIGIIHRQESQMARGKTGRGVDYAYHNEVYQNIPKNMEKITQHVNFDKMTVYGRNYKKFGANKLQEFTYAQDKKMSREKFLAAFKHERDRRLTKTEYAIVRSYERNTTGLIEERLGKDSGRTKEFQSAVFKSTNLEATAYSNTNYYNAYKAVKENDIKGLKENFSVLTAQEKKGIKDEIYNAPLKDQEKFRLIASTGDKGLIETFKKDIEPPSKLSMPNPDIGKSKDKGLSMS